ncbi:hypothetical protein CK224_04720 [Mesorhizobium sp. WSM3862]|nr:hypothetical protein CK224_04720 [Mesorhizobium sp. WSM3862]
MVQSFGQPPPEVDHRGEVESMTTVLREGGHQTPRCDTDQELLASLLWFIPPIRVPGPSGIAFNMRTVVRARSGLTHVPANVQGAPAWVALDKVIAKRLAAAPRVHAKVRLIVADGECPRAAIPKRNDGVSLLSELAVRAKTASKFRSASPSRQR